MAYDVSAPQIIAVDENTQIVLYELTRHSDHHFKSSKKYQILDCHDESPQMPFGYPTSVVLAMFPPLWFRIMNKRVPKEMILT